MDLLIGRLALGFLRDNLRPKSVLGDFDESASKTGSGDALAVRFTTYDDDLAEALPGAAAVAAGMDDVSGTIVVEVDDPTLRLVVSLEGGAAFVGESRCYTSPVELRRARVISGWHGGYRLVSNTREPVEAVSFLQSPTPCPCRSCAK